ncbi:ribosomal maturation YjgA family protein [Streptosporangium soli]|nr:DUF2809 domain-containing protein [Streptosporangium sp. KLBMP 9127]
MRALAALAAVLTVAAGLSVRAFTDGAFAKYAGDALYTVLVFALILTVLPRLRLAVAALAALAVSWAVEFAQLTGVPAELAAITPLARLVFGTSFNPPDLFWYAVGAGAAWAVAVTVTRRTRLA